LAIPSTLSRGFRVIQRLLKPIVDVREEESIGVLLMFSYSFLAMTCYNILKPITRSKFISSLGSENLPYVLLVAGVLIGIIMQGYSKLADLVPRKWVIPAAQAVLAGLLVVFWFLFQTGAEWVSALFYLMGLILGILLISQFWTLANEIYDPRQAKRIFGFIGGGASLGGIAGSSILAFMVDHVGTNNLLLVSAALLFFCVGIVVLIIQRSGDIALAGVTSTGEESEVGGAEGFKLLMSNRHLQIIAAVIAFAAIGAGLIEQQLNMAAEAFKGRGDTDSLTQFLGTVQLYTSMAGFVIQIWLTSRIHKFLGIGFALLILPVSLGATGILMLLRGALWVPGLARVLDTSLRYTVDKTTREILYLPLSSDVKQRAKPFVDVTIDRGAKAVSALLALVLIAPWGLNWDWQRLSIASLVVTGLWIFTAQIAKRGYLRAFRNSIERRVVAPAEVRVNVGDLQTVETLIAELSDPDEARVLYAIDVLEALDKRTLITPLLLYHESPKVRVRVLNTLAEMPPATADRWRPNIRKHLSDESPEVRAAAIVALARLGLAEETELARPYLDDRDPKVASTAAVVMAQSRRAADKAAAEQTLARLVADADGPSSGRREVAKALRQITDPQFQSLLIPLLSDSNPSVAEEAMRSVQALGTANFLFVPALVSLLRDRRLKSAARDVLVSYGEPIVDTLAFFLSSQEEEIWVRRHIPATLARIPIQKSMDVLIAALKTERDGFTRFKLVTAIDRLRREHPELTFDKKSFEGMILSEGNRYFEYLSLHYNLFGKGRMPAEHLLADALAEKVARAKNRVYLLLGLIYPWKDIVAARWAIENGDARAKSSAIEYLDNVFEGSIRRRIMPILDDMPIEERIRRGNVLIKTRERDVEESLLQLINDEDEVVSATAIDLVGRTKISSMADDVEHVLAHRDVHDWWVFESASWTLAGFRVEQDRRAKMWLEPLPAVEVVARLREIAIFKAVTIDELFRIVRAGRQVRHEPGRVLYQQNQPAGELQLLLDGHVQLSSGSGAAGATAGADGAGGQTGTVEAPAPLGIEEVLEGRPVRATVRTLDTCICLALSLEDARNLLSDNTDLVQGLFRWALDHPAFRTEHVVMPGGELPAVAEPPDGALRPIDKVLMLQRLHLLSRMPVEERMAMSTIATEVRLAPGSALFDEADPPALHTIIDGKVTLAATDGLPVIEADSGDAIGLFETLAGVPIGRSARVTEAGRALRISHDDLFDLISQRPSLMQHLFTGLFGRRRA
jgi:AAA family ATP:ADP antiporter